MIKLDNIKLRNFKCFSEELNLKLGKLTLLTGANSTGKSSLMYGMNQGDGSPDHKNQGDGSLQDLREAPEHPRSARKRASSSARDHFLI